MVAAMNRRLISLRTSGGPFDGAAQLHGAKRRNHLVGVYRNLATEPAADLCGDDTYLVFGYSSDQRGQEPAYVRILAGAPQR